MLIFIIILIVNIIIGYVIFGDQFREKPIFHYETSTEHFGSTAIGFILFYLISSVCLIFLLARIDIYVVNLMNFPYKEQFISSGLSFAICLLPTGYLIRWIYNVIFFVANKIGEKHNTKYMEKISDNEQTLILIVSCIALTIIAIVNEKDYELGFFIIALILGKFFWVDSNIKGLISDICKIKIQVFVAVFLYWTLSIYISSIFGEKIVLINMFGITVGFIIGILLYILKNRNRE